MQLAHVFDLVEKKDWTSAEKVNLLSIFDQIDQGKIFITLKKNEQWIVDESVKVALTLLFRFFENQLMAENTYDKIPLKFESWKETDFKEKNIRVVPGSIVRYTAFIESGVVIMPSFINIGAYIGEGTMVDSMTTVGSCVRIGKKCHISSGVTLAGVLEPAQAKPVIIEDYCFIGANSVIAEGVIIGKGSVIAPHVSITGSTKIFDRTMDMVYYNEVPPFSVVVPGIHQGSICPMIIKKVDEKTRSKVSINELLR